MSYQKSIIHSIRWTAFEAILYYALYCIHQFALFKTVSTAEFGIIGTFFSTLYLITTLANGGLENSLSPFFRHASKSKQLFKKIIGGQILIHAGLLLLALLTTALVYSHALLTFPQPYSDQLLLISAASLVISEMLKKNLRMVAHLAFKSNAVAFIEVTAFALYLIVVWGLYGMSYDMSLNTMITTFAFFSWLIAASLAWQVYNYYQALPAKSLEHEHQNITYNIGISRLSSLLHTISNALFSSYFLIPIIAFYAGFAQAGIITLVSTISYTITAGLKKIFGFSSHALFANIRHLDHADKQKAFMLINKKLNTVLVCLVIGCALLVKLLTTYRYYELPEVSYPTVILFLLLVLSENFFIVHEKFSITEEKTKIVWLVNVVTLTMTYAMTYIASNYACSLTTMLCALFCIRLLTFVLYTRHYNAEKTFLINSTINANKI